MLSDEIFAPLAAFAADRPVTPETKSPMKKAVKEIVAGMMSETDCPIVFVSKRFAQLSYPKQDRLKDQLGALGLELSHNQTVLSIEVSSTPLQTLSEHNDFAALGVTREAHVAKVNAWKTRRIAVFLPKLCAWAAAAESKTDKHCEDAQLGDGIVALDIKQACRRHPFDRSGRRMVLNAKWEDRGLYHEGQRFVFIFSMKPY